MSVTQPVRKARGYGLAIIALSLVGLFAAFELTIEKIAVLEDPSHIPACDLSVLVSCGENLSSWQGSVFGFPNPILGLIGWTVFATIGVLIASGVGLPRWFWWGMTAGITAALLFVLFLIYTSLFELETLCPWCMVTWIVTFAVFWLVWSEAIAMLVERQSIDAAERIRSLSGWTTLATIVWFLVVLAVAQLQMNALTTILRDVTG